MFHAQVIVDAFSKALQEKQCMSRIPIAIYTETELFEERLKDTLSYFETTPIGDPLLQPSATYTYTVPGDTDKSTIQKPEERTSLSDPQDFSRDWNNECFNCTAEFPDFDLDSLFGSLLRRIKDFIEQIKNMFNFDLPNFCQFAHMLSYVCIPDLVAILALILAAILKLIGSIFLGTFSLMAFILGLIQTIIGALLRFVLSMIRYALKPITCLLDALADIANKIPSKEVLQKRLSEEEYELLYNEASDDEAEDLPSTISTIGRVVNGTAGDAGSSIKGMLQSVTGAVAKASDSVQDSIDDMFSLVGYLECEPKRSGVSIFEKINEIIELVQIANMIMALIDRKAANDAYDKLCKSIERDDNLNSTGSVLYPNNIEDIGGLTPSEIAEIIQDAIGVDTTIVTDEDTGIDIGVLIKKEVEYKTRLDFFSCDIPDIIKEYNLEPIIDRATAIAEKDLFGRGPGEPRTTNIERVNVNEVKDIDDTENLQFLPFEAQIDADTNVSDIIRELISTRIQENGFGRIIPEEDDIMGSQEDFNSGIKEPDTIPSSDDYSLGIPVSNSIPASTFNKPVELKCGSIANIEEQFSIFEDNT